MPVTNYYTVDGSILGEATGGVRTDYLTDALGSVTATLDSAGNLLNTYRYKPYGEQLAKTGAAADPKFTWVGTLGYRQTGRKHSDTYVRARHYGSAQGRWTTVDPIRRESDDLNYYRYVGNGPVTYKDPSGTSPLINLQDKQLSPQELCKQQCFRSDTSQRLDTLLNNKGCKEYFARTYGPSCNPKNSSNIINRVSVIGECCEGNPACGTGDQLLETRCPKISIPIFGGLRLPTICISLDGFFCSWHATAQSHLLLHEFAHACQCSSGWAWKDFRRPNKFENCACQAMKRCGVAQNEIDRHIKAKWCDPNYDEVDCSAVLK